MYVVAAERQGADTRKLNGTLQTDIFKEYIAQKEWIYPPEPHLKLIGDLMEYVATEAPAYKPLSVSGYHIREAGATAAQELAFTLADGFGYVELGKSRGLDVDQFAPGLSFFFDAHIDFFEEIAKLRAARRIWARWMRDVYGAKTDRAQWLRFHTQTAGVSLTAQQPDNNIVRTAVEALAAVLAGTNSLHTNALDEVLALPSAQRGADRAAHPAGDRRGDRRAQRRRPARRLVVRRGADRPARGRRREDLRTHQGARRRRHDHLRPAARHRGRLVHQRDRRLGVRLPGRAREGRQARRRRQHAHRRRRRTSWRSCACRTRSSSSSARWSRQRRADRDQAAVDAALERMVEDAKADRNTLPAMLDAARAEATLGEICNAFKPHVGRVPRGCPLLTGGRGLLRLGSREDPLELGPALRLVQIDHLVDEQLEAGFADQAAVRGGGNPLKYIGTPRKSSCTPSDPPRALSVASSRPPGRSHL